jgi:Acyl-CoA dehydrogenases
MNFDLSDEQKFMAEQVLSLLKKYTSDGALRAHLAEHLPYHEPLWREVSQMGVPGIAIEEEFGGMGLGEIDLAILAAEFGRTVAPVPFFSSVCLATEVLRLAASAEQKRRLLPRLASGETIGVLVWDSDCKISVPGVTDIQYVDGRLDGEFGPVPDAGAADICVVAVQHNGRPALALVESLDDVKFSEMVGLEQMRHHSRVRFDGAKAELLPAGDAADILRRMRIKAAVYGAFEQVGGAEGCLYMVRDYTLGREVYDKPLASYQAVKHRLADLFADVEIAKSCAYYAAWALEADAPDLVSAAAAARIASNHAYDLAARENLQFHGGVGFTLDVDVHFHYRRARLLTLQFGGTEQWSDELIRTMTAQNLLDEV